MNLLLFAILNQVNMDLNYFLTKAFITDHFEKESRMA